MSDCSEGVSTPSQNVIGSLGWGAPQQPICVGRRTGVPPMPTSRWNIRPGCPGSQWRIWAPIKFAYLLAAVGRVLATAIAASAGVLSRR